MFQGRKDEFAAWYGKELNTWALRWTFAAIERHEDAFAKDACQFDKTELQTMLDDVLGMRASSKPVRMVIIRRYLHWCKQKGYGDAYDYLNEMDLDGLGKVREKMVKDPDDLQSVFDSLFTPESAETIDNVYRGWLWLGFLGVAKDDCGTVKTGSVDLGAGLLHYRGEDLPICEQAVLCMTNLVMLSSFNVMHPNYKKPSRADRMNSNNLLRGIRTEFELKTAQSKLPHILNAARTQGKTTRRPSFDNVAYSGMFYRAYMIELETGVDPDFIDEATRRVKLGGPLTCPPGVSVEALFNKVRNRKAKDFRQDYLRWKEAFWADA